MKEVVGDPNHEEHGGMLEWLGLDNAADFDANACDPAEINDLLEMIVATRR